MLVISLATVLLLDAFGGADKVRDYVAGSGVWAPLVFVALKAATYVIAPLSGTPMKITAGALFGVWGGLALLTIGDLLGGSLNFWIARLLGRPGIRRFAGPKAIKKVDETVEHVGGWRALLMARLILSPIYDFISYAAGMSNLKYRHFVWVTLVGGIPAGIVFVFFGDSLTKGPAVLWVLVSALVVLGLAMLLGRAAKRG
jgi:uncharacterized membrane protein YdjX (TVP38/TMEM64 family)